MTSEPGPRLSIADQIREAQRIEAISKRASRKPEKTVAEENSEAEESTSEALEAVKLRTQNLKLDQRQQDMGLRKALAYWAVFFVCVQLLAANVFFGIYLGHNAVKPDTAVMIAWLTSTVVEVIGILWVIARSLFPFKDKLRNKEAEKASSAPASGA